MGVAHVVPSDGSAATCALLLTCWRDARCALGPKGSFHGALHGLENSGLRSSVMEVHLQCRTVCQPLEWQRLKLQFSALPSCPAGAGQAGNLESCLFFAHPSCVAHRGRGRQSLGAGLHLPVHLCRCPKPALPCSGPTPICADPRPRPEPPSQRRPACSGSAAGPCAMPGRCRPVPPGTYGPRLCCKRVLRRRRSRRQPETAQRSRRWAGWAV